VYFFRNTRVYKTKKGEQKNNDSQANFIFYDNHNS